MIKGDVQVSEHQGMIDAMEADTDWRGREPRQHRWKLAAVLAVVLLLLGANAPTRTDAIPADQIHGTTEVSERLLDSSPVSTPIPPAALLLGTGLLGLVLLRRRSTKN